MKKSVNDLRNSFKNKKFLYSPNFHIQKIFAERAIQTSKFKNNQNLGNQPHFLTKSPGHDWLIDLIQVTNKLLRKAITFNFPLSKPVSLGNCMLERDATVSHKFSPIK